MWQGSAERSEAGVEAELPPERDSPAAQAGSEPQVSHEIDATIHSHRDGPPALLVGEEMATPLRGGTTSSNPLSSSRESGKIVGSATLAGRGRCFTAPRLFIWGLSISRAPLQTWAGNVLATSSSESGLGDDMAR